MTRHRSAPLLICLAVCIVASGCGRLRPLSTEEALDRLTVATSKVYDARGNVIADLHGEINRDIARLDQVPKHVRDAVVAVEDERFWRHQGLDLRSITRAAISNFRSDPDAKQLQGGSTISQQLTKNLYFPRPARTLQRKVQEARVTWQIERQYTKSEILEMYLNTIYLGRGVYGIETAAHSYFDKPASDLTLSQGAFLAGLIHEPARYEWAPSDPSERQKVRLDEAKRRRNYVLERMHREGMLTDDAAADAKDEPLDVKPAAEQRWKSPYFVDLVLRQLGVLRSPGGLDPRFDFLGSTRKERGSNVYLRGLRIHTTLDPEAQEAAEKAVKVLPPEFERLSVALASIEPANGYVRALIGGRDYYPECKGENEQQTHRCRLAKVNLALGRYAGGSGRQPGSSFKPFVLATALERGVPLYQTFSGAPFEHPLQGSEPWRVRNYEGSSGGSTTLVDGTARSVNAVFARLEIEGAGDGDAFVGASRVAQTARRMGIDFPTPDELRSRCGDEFGVSNRCIPADKVPAIALGAKEVSPLSMASAYATFANDGTRVEPTAIVRIQDAEGRVLYDAEPGSVRAIPEGVARGVTYALQQVLTKGTGTRAAISRPAAAKTGTSQEWRDAWLAGYVPQLATVVWVGNPLHALESMTPANGYPLRIVGGSYPAMIWHEYMTRALEGVPVVEFKAPPSQLFRGSAPVATPEPSPTPTGSPSDEELETAQGEVPSVLGMSFGDARSSLRARGFDPEAERGCDPSGEAELHEVYAQSPEAGAEVPQGSTVTVFYQASC